MLVVVTEDNSRVEDASSRVQAHFANSVSWLRKGSGRMILAVGAPSEWRSTLPLPPSAVSTKLVSAALEDPIAANELWGPFLSYLVLSARPNIWCRLAMIVLPRSIPVKIDLRSEILREAVARAIPSSPLGRKFRILGRS
jgi:hypothetical protein